MEQYKPPIGSNYNTIDWEIPIEKLCKSLLQIVSFLQSIDPYIELKQYEDWWEHDGFHKYKKTITFSDLFSIVRSSRQETC